MCPFKLRGIYLRGNTFVILPAHFHDADGDLTTEKGEL